MFNNKSVWVDKDEHTVKVEKEEVMKTMDDHFVLKIQWCDGKWEEWGDLQSSSEFSSLKANAQKKLDRVKGFMGKGKAKGIAQ